MDIRKMAKALKFALTTRPSKPDASWFVRRSSASVRARNDSNLLLVIGVLFGVFLGLGLAVVGLGWIGLLMFIIVSYIFLRAAHRLEGDGVNDGK